MCLNLNCRQSDFKTWDFKSLKVTIIGKGCFGFPYSLFYFYFYFILLFSFYFLFSTLCSQIFFQIDINLIRSHPFPIFFLLVTIALEKKLTTILEKNLTTKGERGLLKPDFANTLSILVIILQWDTESF